jgi:hypothetical protein
MRVEKGKYYRDGNDRVIGPMMFTGNDEFLHLVAEVYVSDTPPVDALKTEAELRQMMRDPRYWRAREPEFVKRVTDGFRALVGGDTPPADAPETKTLRDEFAMAALIGLTAAGGDLADCGRDEIAAEAWRQADAMMEARKK